jgi:dTMP kinase
MRGRFITFEGGEGCGKTTHLSLLAKYLKEKGHSVVQTREPGGTLFSDRIRMLILDNANESDLPQGSVIDAKTELFLMLASRAQHVKEVILPALKSGQIVLCDRFVDASIAYQGAGRGLSKATILEMSLFASQGIMPDLTFLLDIDVSEGLARVASRGELNRLDKEATPFHTAVHRGYEDISRESPERVVVIDASVSIEAVATNIKELADAFLS